MSTRISARPFSTSFALVLLNTCCAAALSGAIPPGYTFTGPLEVMTGVIAVSGSPGAGTKFLIADFNCDGIPDVLSLGRTIQRYGPGQDAIGAALGKGDGTFHAPLITIIGQGVGIGPGTGILAAAVGDFNSDGLPDLLLTRGVVSAVFAQIWTGDGTGMFSAGATIPVTSSPLITDMNFGAVLAVDLNQDGRLDVIVGTANTITVFLGNGDGTFDPPVTTAVNSSSGALTPFLQSADVNGDGKPDILADYSSSSDPYLTDIITLLNSGGGRLTQASVVSGTSAGAAPYGFAVADFNGDGVPDLAEGAGADSSSTTGEIRVFLGNGDGTYGSPALYALPGLPSSLLAADIDNNSGICPELLAVVNGFVYVLPNLGAGQFGVPFQLISGDAGGGIAVTDVNADGWADIITQNTANGTVLLGTGDGQFLQPTFSSPAGTGGQTATRADFNNDGVPDVLLSNGELLAGLASGGFGAPRQVGFAGQAITSADFDGDGNVDVAFATSAASVVVALGHGDGTFTKGATYDLNGVATGLAAVDLNHDRHPDLVMLVPNEIAVLPGVGDGTFSPPVYQPAIGGFVEGTQVQVADFNNDGFPDIAVMESHGIAIFPGNGTEQLGAPMFVTLQDAYDPMSLMLIRNPSTFLVGDLNGDGKTDVIIGYGMLQQFSGGVTLLAGQGDGTFTQTDLNLSVSVEPLAFGVADFNGDGIADLAICGYSGDLTIELGPGLGVSARQQTYIVGPACNQVLGGATEGSGIATLTGTFSGPSAVVVLAPKVNAGPRRRFLMPRSRPQPIGR